MNQNKKMGISLILLVITIIVIIILAGAVILNLAKYSPIDQASKAKFQNDIRELQSELQLYISKQYTDNLGNYDPKLLQADENSITYDTTVDSNKSIDDIITSLPKTNYEPGDFAIVDGELVYKGDDTNLQDLAEEIGLQVIISTPVVVVNQGYPYLKWQDSPVTITKTVDPGGSTMNIGGVTYTIVRTVADLTNVRNNLTSNYIQMADIDMSSVNWYSIGGDSGGYPPSSKSYTNPFKGIYDGNGYKITNLHNNFPTYLASYEGLFGLTDSATIKNVTIEGINFSGSYYPENNGGLIGYAVNTTIQNCNLTNLTFAFSSSNDVGGLVGTLYNSTVQDSSVSGTSTISGDENTGGLFGFIDGASSSVTRCYSTANVSATGWDSGGIAGYIKKGTISLSYSKGNIGGAAANAVGGAVGECDQGIIQNCYSIGNVVGSGDVGGFAGYTGGLATTASTPWSPVPTITNCYAVSAVTGSTTTNGMLGKDYGLTYNSSTTKNKQWAVITSTYYDGTVCALAANATNVSKTTSELKTESSLTGWDFTNVWDISPSVN